MYLPLRAHFQRIPPSRIHHHHYHHHYQVFSKIKSLNSCISSLCQWRHRALKKNFVILRPRERCGSSIEANADDSGAASVGDNFQTDTEGSTEKDESHNRASFSSKEILKKLKRYGVSGILAYGLLNTAYYLTTFLLVWFYVVPAPGKMGYLAAVERFLKLMAMVWAGSQVTKLARAGGALALAPSVDKGLSWFTVKFKFESKGKAFLAIVGLCFGLVAVLFFTITLLWA